MEKTDKCVHVFFFCMYILLSVLVDGNPTKEFQISKGIRQGDKSLAPFLFLKVLEGLSYPVICRVLYFWIDLWIL